MGGFPMRRKLLQFQSLLAQHALREAPKPRPQLQHLHSHLLHSPSDTESRSSSSSNLVPWRRIASDTTAGDLPRNAAAVAAATRTAASRWLAAARGQGSFDLFSLQRGRDRQSGWPSAASAFAQGVPWALSPHWMGSPDGMVWTLIGANVAVFMLWRVADPGFMSRHFMISLDNLMSGRLHTLLTSAFSHAETDHLISNMIGLYFFGTTIAKVFGPAFLLNLYVVGALTGSTFFLVEKAFIDPRRRSDAGWDPSRVAGLGASGAVNAVVLLLIFLYPKSLLYLYFLVPVPAAVLGALLIGSDLYRVHKGQSRVSGSAHLGGALVAALVWAELKTGIFK